MRFLFEDNRQTYKDLKRNMSFVIEYYSMMGYDFPNGYIWNSWEDLKDGFEMGIDDDLETAQCLLDILDSDIKAIEKIKGLKDEDPDYAEFVDLIDRLKNSINRYVKSLNESSSNDSKFVPYDKMSKKQKAEEDRKARGSWNGVNPVSRTIPDKTKYDRNRDKKAIIDEAQSMEDLKKLKFIEKNASDAALRDGYDQIIVRDIETGDYYFTRKYRGCVDNWSGDYPVEFVHLYHDFPNTTKVEISKDIPYDEIGYNKAFKDSSKTKYNRRKEKEIDVNESYDYFKTSDAVYHISNGKHYKHLNDWDKISGFKYHEVEVSPSEYAKAFRTEAINESTINEKLVEAPQEVVDSLIKTLNSYGFVLDDSFKTNPGKTWMGNVHVQVINPDTSAFSYEELKSSLSKKMFDDINAIGEKYDCPITWSFGANKDGKITGGLDISKQYVEDSAVQEALSENVCADEESDTVDRYEVTFYIDNNDFYNRKFVYADSKEEASSKVQSEFACKGKRAHIRSIEKQEVPSNYKNWDLDESFESNYGIKFYQIFENPSAPTEKAVMIAQKGTLEDAVSTGEKLAGKGNFQIKAVCNDGKIKNVYRNTWEDVLSGEFEHSYWYSTKHGVGPGSVPKDIKILDIVDGTRENGWKDYFLSNRLLTTSELNFYDVKEEIPEDRVGRTFSESVSEDLHLVSNRYSPDDPGFDEYDDVGVDFNDGEVEEGNTFFADGKDYVWEEKKSDTLHIDFDNWAVWQAREAVDIRDFITTDDDGKNKVDSEKYLKAVKEADKAFFVVDEDTGFIDWGPCDTLREAEEFLESKESDYDYENYDECYIKEETEDGRHNYLFKCIIKNQDGSIVRTDESQDAHTMQEAEKLVRAAYPNSDIQITSRKQID